jgi:hypothetical protein
MRHMECSNFKIHTPQWHEANFLTFCQFIFLSACLNLATQRTRSLIPPTYHGSSNDHENHRRTKCVKSAHLFVWHIRGTQKKQLLQPQRQRRFWKKTNIVSSSSSHFSIEETITFLTMMEKILPFGDAEWQVVVNLHNNNLGLTCSKEALQ